MFIAFGAVMAGMFYCFLKVIDGRELKFEDLFEGFKQWFVPGLIVPLVIVVPILMVYGVIYVPIIMAAAMGARMTQEAVMSTIVSALAVDAVLIVIMVCLHTLLMFAFPLIADRGLGGFAAMMTSARAVFRNMSGVVGLLLVNFVLILAGELAFCVGIYFVMPILIAGNAVAYRKIFPRL